jgi:hypothetical protein
MPRAEIATQRAKHTVRHSHDGEKYQSCRLVSQRLR